MFQFNQLSQIHLEITNNCQAGCPMCSRNHHGGIDNPLIKIRTWDLKHFKNTINIEVLNQIGGLYFCGNFGDPLLNNDLLDMCKYIVENKPEAHIRIHTNGSLRSINWWKSLASVLPKKHILVFAIDGLSDTHSIYRIKTDYDQIIQNAKAFIEAGGIAEWHFIRFKHNAHQVESARNIAKQMGFKSFVIKDSSRFVLDNKFPVFDSTGKTTHYLEPAIESKITFIDRKIISNYKKIVESSEIDCYVQNTKEIYIDAYGRLFPCCWIASTPYNYIDDQEGIPEIRQLMMTQYEQLIEDFGGVDKIDTHFYSIKNIINSPAYQTIWKKYWSDPKMITCARICGTNPLSKPTDQFGDKEHLL
jgi:MoaA/NifB/PqqE/SkfB family radical SAM enzyme